MPNKKNVAQVQELTTKLEEAAGIYFTDYMGLTVDEINILRRRLHEAGVEYRVVKNTLTAIAAKEVGLGDLSDILQGPTAIALGYDEPTAPARILKEFLKAEGKEKKLPAVKGLVIEGRRLPGEDFERLANLPPREVLLGMFARVLQAPMQNLVGVLQAPMRNLVNVLHQLQEKRN